MKMHVGQVSVLVVAALSISAVAIAQVKSKPLPAVSAMGTDGKLYNKASLSNKATVLVFLKDGCPHNAKAAADLNRLEAAFGMKAQLVGVVNDDLAKAKQFASKLKLNFPLIADADLKVTTAFGATNSLDMAMISSNTKMVAGFWKGYSQATIRELVTSLPTHGGPVLKMDYLAFPRTKTSGCGF